MAQFSMWCILCDTLVDPQHSSIPKVLIQYPSCVLMSHDVIVSREGYTHAVHMCTRATFKHATMSTELFTGTFTKCELYTSSFLIHVCSYSIVMTYTGSFSSRRLSSATKSFVPLVANSSTSYFESSSSPWAEISARPFQLTIESFVS